MARVKLHEAHVLLQGHGTEDGRPHRVPARSGRSAGFLELQMRVLEASPSLGKCRGAGGRIHGLIRFSLRKLLLSQHALEEEGPHDRANNSGKLWKFGRPAS